MADYESVDWAKVPVRGGRRFKYHCPECKFLRSATLDYGYDARYVEMYFCKQDGKPALVCRYTCDGQPTEEIKKAGCKAESIKLVEVVIDRRVKRMWPSNDPMFYALDNARKRGLVSAAGEAEAKVLKEDADLAASMRAKKKVVIEDTDDDDV